MSARDKENEKKMRRIVTMAELQLPGVGLLLLGAVSDGVQGFGFRLHQIGNLSPEGTRTILTAALRDLDTGNFEIKERLP